MTGYNALPVSRKLAKPVWWMNTYFWISAILVIVAIWGLVRGPSAIRDPGQKREDHLVVYLYLIGAVVMYLNGWLSHRQTVQAYREAQEKAE